jgi:hypothetical protein
MAGAPKTSTEVRRRCPNYGEQWNSGLEAEIEVLELVVAPVPVAVPPR